VTVAAGGRGRLYLNGATIMTTPTDQHVLIAREAGYDGVELRAERLLGSPDEVDAAAGLITPGEVWSLNGIQIQLTADGTLDRDRLVAELVPRLEVCRRTKATYLLVVPPRIGGLASDAAVGPVSEGLSIAAAAADTAGVRVAFEFLGFADSPIRTPELAAAVVAGVPAADLVLDSCHWHASGGGPLDAFPVERLAMVHLNDAPEKRPELIEDADRVLPGLGVIRLGDLVAMLRERGYRGPWSLETFNPGYWERDPRAVARDGKSRLDALLA
jgi:2-keto-myo-inositol isomerase